MSEEQPKDIIVTTPRDKMALAEQEAQECIRAGGGFYFRTFRMRPRDLEIGSRIFYVEDGFVRGFGVVSEIRHSTMECATSGKDWGLGYHAIMDAKSWKWIKPIPMEGFQGWRYFDAANVKIIGGWLDRKPAVTPAQKHRRREQAKSFTSS